MSVWETEHNSFWWSDQRALATIHSQANENNETPVHTLKDHLFVSEQEQKKKMPAASNISQINQQYYIKLKTDERLKNWRQGYNEFHPSQAWTKLLFPIEWRLYDTLNPAL